MFLFHDHVVVVVVVVAAIAVSYNDDAEKGILPLYNST